MSPSNSKLSPRCESTSCIQNKNGKRTFLTSDDDITYDNDIYYKRKKSIKHSQVDINNAVLSSPNGYMTRNKLKKQLTKNSELIEATAREHKSSRIDNIKSRKKACKNRKSSSQIFKKKLQLGYIFSNDIYSPYPGKQLDTECKKSIPSLFESDSDSEIDGFQLNNIIKNEVKEISTYNSNSDNICSTLNKNVEMRTYFNKKSYNNKSNTKSLNTFEESKHEPLKLDNVVQLFKSISPNHSRTNKPLKGTGSSTKQCVQTNTMDDDFIIVTESFIRQLNNEDQMIKTESQEQHKLNQVASTILSTDNELNKNNMCTVDTNIDNICSINFDSSTCSDLLLKQDVDVSKVSDKCIPYKTTNIVENSLMSIFDEPKENILIENYTNVDDLINYSESNTSSSISEKIIELNSLQTFDFDNSNSDFCSIGNHPISENNVFKEENITCHLPLDQIKSNSITNQYFDTVIKEEIKIKSNSFNGKINHSCLLENDNLSSNKDNYSKLNKNLGSKCYCKNFSSFNNNDNKIFTSKIKHFAFNNNAKKIRKKILHQKHLEANILKILITKERKNIIQSKDHIPIFDSISINRKNEKFNNLKDNDHIKPSILSMLKDVYVDVDYLTEYCDYNTSDNKLPEPHKNNKDIKFNIQPSKVKPIDDNIHIMFKDNSASTSNYTTKIKPINPKPFYEKDDNFNKKYIIDHTSTSNSTTRKYPINFNSCDKNNVNSNKNKIIAEVNTSNSTIKNKSTHIKPHDDSYVNFNKKEIIVEVNTSNTTIKNKSTNIKPYDESYVNFSKNEIIDEVNTSNSRIKNKSTNIKPYDESYVNFNKNKIIDEVNSSNNTIKNKSTNIKPYDDSYVNFNKKEIIVEVNTSNTTIKNKSTNIKPYDESYVNFSKNEIIDEVNSSNSTIKNKSTNIKPYDESYVNFSKNEIIDEVNTSNSRIKNKSTNIKPYDESYVNFNKNEIIDEVNSSNNTIKYKSTNIKPYDESYVNFSKNEIIDEVNSSNSTIKNKSTNIKPYDESYVNFDKNEIIDEVNTSNSTIKYKSTNTKPYDESYVNLNKNEIIDNSTLNTTMKNKLVNFKPCDESYVYFNKNKIIAEVNTENSTIKNKSTYLENGVNLKKNKIIDEDNISNSTTKNKLINAKPCDKNSVNFNKNEINDNTSTLSTTLQNKLISLKPCDGSYLNFNKNKIRDVKIDSKSKVKVEDNFNFYTADIKYDSKTEKCSGLKINPFDNNHLSDNTIIINEENDSKEEFKMTEVVSNNMQSKTILSSANININHGFTQTKLTHFSKDENKPVAALIENEKETNIQNVFEPPQYKNLFDTSDTISSKADISYPMLPYISQSDEPINNLFDLPVDDIDFSLNINSSNDDDYDDDDDRLLIEDIEQNVDGNVTKNSTLKLANSPIDERTLNLSSAVNTNFTMGIELSEKNLISPIKKQLSDINSNKNEKVLNTILPEKKCDLSNINYENSGLLKKENNSLDDCMSIEMCNEFYKIKSLNKNIDKNESLPRNIKDILKEMYVDELFISTCQHMVDFYNDDDDQFKNDVFFHMNEYRNMQSDMTVRDIKNDNFEKKKKSDFNQLISTNVETLWRTELNGGNQDINNKPINPTINKNSIAMQEPNDIKSILYPELMQSNSIIEETILKSEINNSNQQIKHINPTIKSQKSNSSQNPKNVKSNMKIRIHLKEFILSNKPLNTILESKEFRNLRFFDEEEIASSIGVFIFEHSICPPIITGLSVYKENYDQLKSEEKNKILASTNLNISCPEIMKLTSITLALVKMLRSDTLIEVILNIIRKNVLKKQMNTDHTIDFQLIKQTVYFVDICVRSRMLKTLQLFIFDSMVFLPNKYCCIIFISLLLWKNCLPRSINNEEDPVIITVISYLIAKKKFYSEEIAGCDIFQRELINLLSCHFNYTFTTDMPTNFIQHKHKPDFFVSVVMFLKCCNPKDLVEFIVNCLFPIIDNYLNTQQNEMYAIKTMESINMVMEPFKTTCNTTVATYLKKCKDPTNGFKKNGKEHIYNTIYNSYKILQNKFIEYLNDSRPCSQYFEELLMSIILMLGSVDYLTSCLSLLQWKPKFELSAILSKKIVIFKSVLGQNIVWDKLYAIKDIKTLKCLINSCLLNKDVYDTIVQLHNLRWQLK